MKNCTLKYSCSSTDSTVGRRPLMVKIQRERNRVSSRNKPWVSVGDASRSPRRSLTTNSLPSRMLMVPSDISRPPLGEDRRRRTERQQRGQAEPPVPLDLNEPPLQGRHDRMQPPFQDRLERLRGVEVGHHPGGSFGPGAQGRRATRDL